MYKKLTKHFIYNWLKEDAFGEYMLYKSNFSLLAKGLLLRVWFTFFLRRNLKRLRTLSSVFAPFFIEFSLFRLRNKHFLKQLLPPHQCLSNCQLTNYVFHYKNFLVDNTFKLSENKNSISKVNKHFWLRRLKKMRYNKYQQNNLKLSMSNLSFISSSVLRSKRGKLLLLSSRKPAIRNKNSFKSKVQKICNSHLFLRLSSQKYRRSFVENKHVYFQLIRPLKKISSRIKNLFLHYQTRNLWRFNIQKYHSRSSTGSSSVFLKKDFWLDWNNNLLFKLRRSYTWLLKGYKKENVQHKKAPKFHFQSNFLKKRIKVKRYEKRKILKFRLFSYFNLAGNSREFYLLKGYHYENKLFRLPTLTYFEFRFSTLLLRCNFFENIYIVGSLLKRQLFLINGFYVARNILVNVWDIIALSKKIWWVVYSRFFNFFSAVGIKKSKLYPLKSLFLKRFFISSNLFRKKDWVLSQTINKYKLTHFLALRNFILSSPPSHLEVSYRLLIVVVHKLITSTMEMTQFPNLRGLLKLIPAGATKSSVMRPTFTNLYPLSKIVSSN